MEPSPVLHIRNLPPDVDQEEVFSLAERFGGVRNCLLMRVKNQALLEMNDVGVATAMVASYTASPPILRGKTIYVQYSKHKELRKQGVSVYTRISLFTAHFAHTMSSYSGIPSTTCTIEYVHTDLPSQCVCMYAYLYICVYVIVNL
jgi:RNA recognition motif-containing protein